MEERDWMVRSGQWTRRASELNDQINRLGTIGRTLDAPYYDLLMECAGDPADDYKPTSLVQEWVLDIVKMMFAMNEALPS